MYQFVYVSSAVTPFTDEQLARLLEVSRRRNAECDVTGLLLYLSGNFIQLLEGAKKDVVSTYSRIQADPSHRGLITLLDADADEREFPEWSMGFEKVEGPAAERLPGYSDFLKQETDKSAHRSAALRLLQFFRDLNR
jgi:hypothetical protein